MEDKYFIVKAVCGHVGRGWAVDKDFPICASSGKEAASKVRLYPRVKHDMKYAIKSVTKVGYEEYMNQIVVNNNDPYMHCMNKQEQESLCTVLDVYSIKKKNEQKSGRKISKKAYINNYCYHKDSWE